MVGSTVSAPAKHWARSQAIGYLLASLTVLASIAFDPNSRRGAIIRSVAAVVLALAALARAATEGSP